jgi:hypothetical protein
MSTHSCKVSQRSSLDSDFSASEDQSDDDFALKESLRKKISENKKRARFLEKSRSRKTKQNIGTKLLEPATIPGVGDSSAYREKNLSGDDMRSSCNKLSTSLSRLIEQKPLDDITPNAVEFGENMQSK